MDREGIGPFRMQLLMEVAAKAVKIMTTGVWHLSFDEMDLDAAELAVIVPIPEAVLDDAEFDIFGEVTPRVMEAIGQRVDSAVIFGENRPRVWQNDIITLARQSGNNVAPGSSPDYYDLLLGEGGVISKVEEDGYMVTGALAGMKMRAKLRGIKATDGTPIFKSDMQGSTNYALDGAPMHFPQNGAFNTSIAQLVVGDFKQAVYAIRQDITVKILDQGVIQDPVTKEIVYNLAQQDMVALRVVFRMGWALPNPATRIHRLLWIATSRRLLQIRIMQLSVIRCLNVCRISWMSVRRWMI